jgi:hypothetical protein
MQVPRRALGHILPLRRKGHWLWLRGCTGRATERVPQVIDTGRGRGPGTQDAEAGHGGEARLEERAVGQRHQGQGLQDIRRRGNGIGRVQTRFQLNLRHVDSMY